MSETDIRQGTKVRWRDPSDPASTVGISYGKTYLAEARNGDVIRVNGLLFDVSLFKAVGDAT